VIAKSPLKSQKREYAIKQALGIMIKQNIIKFTKQLTPALKAGEDYLKGNNI